MQLWAIKPNGVGQRPGARAIQPDWELAEGETFTFETENIEDMILAADGVSLEIGEPAPRPEELRVNQFVADVGQQDMLDRLRTATPAQIDTWLANNVTTLAQARTVLGTILKFIVARRLV